MDYNFVDSGPTKNGIYENAKGGTEAMFHGLMERLSPEYKEKFQIICSRVRGLDHSKKKILWLHDTWDDPENNHFKDPSSIDRFDKLVFVSNYQFQTYHQAFNIPYSKSIVLRNAIVPIEYKEKPKDQINLIYHTTPHRGLELVVPVFEHLAKTHSDIHLDIYSSFEIYGWKDRDVPYKKLFDLCESHPQITYHGYQPNNVVREALQKAHIFAFPSIWPETSCLAAIEAGSAGVIVAAPDFAALPETMLNFGFMYRYNEDKQLHANMHATVLNTMILKLKQEPEFQNHLKRQSEVFNNFYSWDTRMIQWNEMLKVLTSA
jgi:UDP-glucose:(glucosyl)LPS alpha-1,2-glucosyltransferase